MQQSELDLPRPFAQPLTPDPMYLSSMLRAAAATLVTAGVASANGTLVVTEPFEGSNDSGLAFIQGADIVEANGGSPGGYLHQPTYDTFAPILRSTGLASDPYSGDYRAMGVTSIAFDAKTDSMNFGTGEGFEMSLILRDTKGTPLVDDDDYAYYVGPNIPLVGAGWTHYELEIPSASTDPVPAGWSGGWVGDLEGFRPGVDWNDVITSVDRIEIQWLHPAFFAIFQQWNVGADNVAIRGSNLSDDTWCDVGHALVGTNGEPRMMGTGTLAPGSPVQLAAHDILGAAPA